MFRTTRWSMISAAARSDDAGRRALAELCEVYWPPVYAFARRASGDPEQAFDLTQGFFADFLARGSIGSAARDRGRFRSYLLGAVRNYTSNTREHERAHKRGGGRRLVSLDRARAERGYELEPCDDETPERAFERLWARTLIDTVLERLGCEYRERDRGAVFDALQPFLEGGDGYASAAEQLGMTVGAVKVTVHRMRRRLGELLVAEVRDTLGDGEDPGQEIAELMRALK